MHPLHSPMLNCGISAFFMTCRIILSLKYKPMDKVSACASLSMLQRCTHTLRSPCCSHAAASRSKSGQGVHMIARCSIVASMLQHRTRRPCLDYFYNLFEDKWIIYCKIIRNTNQVKIYIN